MKILLITFLFSIYSIKSYSQCFDAGGNGDFEGENAINQFVANTQGNGTFEVTSETSYSGSQALKVDVSVAGNWQVRIFNTGTCYFNLTAGESYTISLYLKGDLNDRATVSIMDNTTVDQEEDVFITSTDWKLYTATFTATTTSSSGRIKIIFKDQGVYFVDDIRLNAFDCNGDLGGSASFDACGICSGGSTGISAINDCSSQTIDPTNTNIIYEGALEKEVSASKASLYRFKKTYAATDVSGFYQQIRAVASSGIKIRFKTTSPTVKAFFEENTTLGDDVFWHTFDIFKNGVFQFDSQGWEIEMKNPKQELVEWEISLPSYSMVEFLKLEIVNGFSLNSITKEKPIYVAIGNSITHGLGIDAFSTRLTYPHVVADSLGYELYNWGIGGSKIYDGILDNFSTGLQPDLITVLWGYNDVHYSGHDSYLNTTTFPKYKTILSTMAQDFPDACILAILATYTENPINTDSRTIDSLRSGQLEVIKELQMSYSNINYMDGRNYTNADGLNDDVHFNSKGNRSLAHGIINELPCNTPTKQENITIDSFIAYPNPSSGILFFGEKIKVEVLTYSGEVILSAFQEHLDLTGLAKGIYFLKTDKGVSKIILK